MSSASIFSTYCGWDTLLCARLGAETFLNSSLKAAWHWVDPLFKKWRCFYPPHPDPHLTSAPFLLGSLGPGRGRVKQPELLSLECWAATVSPPHPCHHLILASEASCPQAGPTDLGPLTLPILLECIPLRLESAPRLRQTSPEKSRPKWHGGDRCGPESSEFPLPQ